MDYITNEETIIFSPDFNKPLDPAFLSNYKKIIFSNYKLDDNLFEAYENNNFNDLIHISSKFNQSLEHSLNNLTSLTNLTFGAKFNQALDNFLEDLTSLTHLTFGKHFNQKDDLPTNIKLITINCNNSYYILTFYHLILKK